MEPAFLAPAKLVGTVAANFIRGYDLFGYGWTVNSWCYLLCRMLGHGLTWPFVRLQIWRAPGAIEPDGAAVLVANHISHFDPLFLAIAFHRTIDWMTTEEFYENRLAAVWLRAVNTFPVDRSRPDRRVLRLGMERLRAKRVVGVFPEGGIRAGATSLLGGAPPKRGATALARLASVPIIPCIVLGTDRLYAKSSWWPGPPRISIWATIGAPFAVSDLDSEEADMRMADALRELATATIAHFDLGPDDLPATPQHRKGRDAEAVA